jgi:enamine deaminase RidA (YjgF/YER057c/UK114 family)
MNDHKRQNFSSGTPWEPIAGYCRAVKIGSFIYISGTTATDSQGHIVGINDATTQTIQTLRNIESALKKAGATLENVVRTRIYITDIKNAEKICLAHGEFFRKILPACTLVEVKGLILPEMLVEIECDAII